MKLRGSMWCGAFACLALTAMAADSPGDDGSESTGALDVMKAYSAAAYAEDLDATTRLFEQGDATYFHINGIYYFTADAEQSIFQTVNAKDYVDGWGNIRQGFSDYFAGLVQAISVKTAFRTDGQGMRAPLDGGDKLQGETGYVILAKFYLDAQGDTGWAIVHGLDQFRIKHGKIQNINNLEKTVWLTAEESAYVDSLASQDAKIAWASNRTCELLNSVFATIDIEKRWDIGLTCP